MSDWKNETCEDCMFKVGLLCRRFPPIRLKLSQGGSESRYPRVADYVKKNDIVYELACAEYKKEYNEVETR